MIIKDLLVKGWSVLWHPFRWFKGKTIVLSSKVKGVKGNSLWTENCLLKKSLFVFDGKNNSINLSGCEVYNCTLFLRGDGHRIDIEEGVRLYNMQIKIIGSGNSVLIGPKSTLGSGHIVSGGKQISIRIGKNCMIADGVDIWSTDTHSVFQEGKLINEPQSIIIGDHVWIGKDVAILKGVIIGNNAVVGMRSLVTKDILSGTLNVGSPAKQIKEGIDWRRSNPNNE